MPPSRVQSQPLSAPDGDYASLTSSAPSISSLSSNSSSRYFAAKPRPSHAQKASRPVIPSARIRSPHSPLPMHPGMRSTTLGSAARSSSPISKEKILIEASS
eukprot:gene963-1045_t